MTVCFCHCCLPFSNIFCQSLSVFSISVGSFVIFDKTTMASSTPSSKRRRKAVDNKSADDKEVDSNIPIGTLLHNRKNLPKLVQTKNKTPAILTQDTAKSSSNPFWSTRSVASLSAKKQRKRQQCFKWEQFWGLWYLFGRDGCCFHTKQLLCKGKIYTDIRFTMVLCAQVSYLQNRQEIGKTIRQVDVPTLSQNIQRKNLVNYSHQTPKTSS